MTLPELLEIDIRGKDICVIGKPGAGKTTIARLLSRKWGVPLLSTDDFRTGNFEEDLYSIIEHLHNRTGNVIVEGVQVARLLRKGLQPEYHFQPDVVIECLISDAKQAAIYRRERDVKKLKYMRSFNAGLEKVFSEYLFAVPEDRKPLHIELQNEY